MLEVDVEVEAELCRPIGGSMENADGTRVPPLIKSKAITRKSSIMRHEFRHRMKTRGGDKDVDVDQLTVPIGAASSDFRFASIRFD